MPYVRKPITKITYDLLVKKAACGERLVFAKLFPDGWVPTEDEAVRIADDLDWWWGGVTLLNKEGSELFRLEDGKFAARRREAIQQARRDFIHTTTPDRDNYHLAVQRSDCEYRIEVAKTFVRLFRVYPIVEEVWETSSDANDHLAELRRLLSDEQMNTNLDHYIARDLLLKVQKEFAALDTHMSNGHRSPQDWLKRKSAAV